MTGGQIQCAQGWPHPPFTPHPLIKATSTPWENHTHAYHAWQCIINVPPCMYVVSVSKLMPSTSCKSLSVKQMCHCLPESSTTSVLSELCVTLCRSSNQNVSSDCVSLCARALKQSVPSYCVPLCAGAPTKMSRLIVCHSVPEL